LTPERAASFPNADVRTIVLERRTDPVLACSHAVFATADVGKMMRFVEEVFSLAPKFENEEFGEFVLASGFRLAFFLPTGLASRFFSATRDRAGSALGVTVADVDALHARVAPRAEAIGLTISGPPKTHPWGEKSFLLVDPDGNRWEITESPSRSGMLVDR
jgi:uncharacterized glyoxalase superfamily protein PhnB